MAIKEVTRYQTSDGKKYETEREALTAQSFIDKQNFNSTVNKLYNDFLLKGSESKENGTLYKGIISDQYGLTESERVLSTIILDYPNNGMESILLQIIKEKDNL